MTITELSAREHIADLRRSAAARAARAGRATAPDARIELRLAGPDDEAVALRLAALDSAAPLREPVLLGLLDDRPVAALSLHDHRVVADPFVLTGPVVALLRMRAAQSQTSRAGQPLRRRLAALRLVGAHS